MFTLGPPADPFMEERLFIASPWPVHILLVAYVLFVLKLGQKFMKHRKPYNVKNIVLVYNILQVIYNGISVCLAINYLVLNPVYELPCMKNIPFDSPLKDTERWLGYIYFLNKILDLMDTVFFVLRKSYRQITLLHVYHHVLMVFGIYWGMWYYGFIAQVYLMGCLNVFVHTFMYFYYFLTTLKPEMKTKLWLKKSITIIQLIQFLILLIQSIYILIFNPTCEVPLSYQYWQLVQSSLMLYMFGRFYINAYMKPEQKKN